MYCNKCGKELRDGAAFCAKCGAPVKRHAAMGFVAGGVSAGAAAAGSKDAQTAAAGAEQTPKKKKTGFVIGLLLLVCVLGAGALYWFVLRKTAIDLNEYVAVTFDDWYDGKSARAGFEIRKLVDDQEKIFKLTDNNKKEIYTYLQEKFPYLIMDSLIDAAVQSQIYADQVRYHEERTTDQALLELFLLAALVDGANINGTTGYFEAEGVEPELLKGSFDKKDGLSDGDKITFSWSAIDTEIVEKLFPVKLTWSDFSVTVGEEKAQAAVSGASGAESGMPSEKGQRIDVVIVPSVTEPSAARLSSAEEPETEPEMTQASSPEDSGTETDITETPASETVPEATQANEATTPASTIAPTQPAATAVPATTPAPTTKSPATQPATTAAPTTKAAETTAAANEAGNLRWSYNESTATLTISGSGAMNINGWWDSPWEKYEDNIASIIIGDGITSISDYAFCFLWNLEKIQIPASVKSIGYYSLHSCSSLKEIRFGGTSAQWEAIAKNRRWNLGTGKYTIYCSNGNVQKAAITQCGDNVYWSYDAATKTLTISGTGEMDSYNNGGAPWRDNNIEITKIVISEGITKLNSMPFRQENNVTEVSFPSTLKEIGGAIFYSTKLKTIRYQGTKAQWNQIKKDESSYYPWDDGLGTYQIICTDGAIEKGISYSCGPNAVWAYDKSTDTLTITGSGKIENDTWTTYVAELGKTGYRYDYKKLVIGEGITDIEGVWSVSADTVVLPSTVKNWVQGRAFLDSKAPEFIIAAGCDFQFDKAHNCMIQLSQKRLVMAWPGATIPDDGSVEIIGTCAFNWFDYDKRTVMEVPATIKKVEWGAFANWDPLEEVIFYSPNTVIDDNEATISSREHDVALAGYAGSTAEAWAKAHGRSFRKIN